MRERVLEAEGRLFARFGLRTTSRWLGGARVLESGEGPPLLFLHGAGAISSMWAPLWARLPDRRLIGVDLPGYGLSDPFDYTGRDIRDVAVGFVRSAYDELGLDAAPLAGNSLGGMYGMWFALAHPERVSALAVIGEPAVCLDGARGNVPMGLMSFPPIGRSMGALMAKLPMTSRAVRGFLGRAGGKPSLRDVPQEMFEMLRFAMPAGTATTVSLFPLLMRWRTPHRHLVLTDDELRAIEVPTLFVWGDRDVFQAPDGGRRACELMPDARMEVISGGHHPWWDDPAGCAELLAGFLAEHRLV
jgi:pimeloyl-ACP methyl ester carboxylesterase